MVEAFSVQGFFILLIILIAIVAAIGWMLIISSGYKLDEANKVGKAKESNCGEFYLEGESARSSIYDAFRGEGGIEQRLNVVFQIFYYSLYILMLALGAYFLFYLLNIEKPDGTTFGPPPYGAMEKILFNWIFIGGGLVGVFIAWNVVYFKSDDQTINPFQNALYKFGTDGKVNEDTKKDILGRQAGLLGGFAIVLAGITYTFLHYKREPNALDVNILRYIWTIFIVIAIFILYITNEIYGLTANIRINYQKKSEEVNQSLRNNLTTNTTLENNLRNNIRSLDQLDELPPAGLKDNETYKDKLYRYVMNAVNMAEIRNVVIPEELNEIIDPQFLRGEGVITMKNDFLIYHNDPTLGNFNTYVKKYLKTDYKNVASAPANASLTAPWDSCSSTLGGGDLVKCKAVKDLTQRYIVENDTYNVNNVVPVDVRNKLLAMRGDLTIVAAAHKFYKNINIISVVVFLTLSYILFHRLYEQNPSMAQVIAFIMILIVMLVGFVGWFFKDLWL